jgi:hypothetical protein
LRKLHGFALRSDEQQQDRMKQIGPLLG